MIKIRIKYFYQCVRQLSTFTDPWEAEAFIGGRKKKQRRSWVRECRGGEINQFSICGAITKPYREPAVFCQWPNCSSLSQVECKYACFYGCIYVVRMLTLTLKTYLLLASNFELKFRERFHYDEELKIGF
jgi:hypothetical protein